MNKAELVDVIAKRSGLTKVDAKKALDAFINVSKETLCNNERISLVGFGSFYIQERPARKGRNPRTGAEITIEEKKIVKFKPGAELVKGL